MERVLTIRNVCLEEKRKEEKDDRAGNFQVMGVSLISCLRHTGNWVGAHGQNTPRNIM